MELKDMMGMPLLPINAVEHGAKIDFLMSFVHWVMVLLFVGWGLFLVYTIYRFRSSAHPKAEYEGMKSSAPKYLEIAVIALELVFLVGLSLPLWANWADEFPPEDESVVVRAVAEQFAWNFHYAGPDGRFGARRNELIEAHLNPLGIDFTDPYAKDDVVSKVMHLPVNRPIITHITSKDVIHGFGVPALRLKQDAIPGMSIPIHYKPTRVGKYLIACSQLCGVGHAKMRGFLQVHSQADFNAWMDQQVEQSKMRQPTLAKLQLSQ